LIIFFFAFLDSQKSLLLHREDSVATLETQRKLVSEKQQSISGTLRVFTTAHKGLHLQYRTINGLLKDAKRGIKLEESTTLVGPLVSKITLPDGHSIPLESLEDVAVDMEAELDMLQLDAKEEAESRKFEESKLYSELIDHRLYLLRVLRQYATALRLPKDRFLQLQLR
jgi:hypothetical protein